jgi:hypothetical protein
MDGQEASSSAHEKDGGGNNVATATGSEASISALLLVDQIIATDPRFDTVSVSAIVQAFKALNVHDVADLGRVLFHDETGASFEGEMARHTRAKLPPSFLHALHRAYLLHVAGSGVQSPQQQQSSQAQERRQQQQREETRRAHQHPHQRPKPSPKPQQSPPPKPQQLPPPKPQPAAQRRDPHQQASPPGAVASRPWSAGRHDARELRARRDALREYEWEWRRQRQRQRQQQAEIAAAQPHDHHQKPSMPSPLPLLSSDGAPPVGAGATVGFVSYASWPADAALFISHAAAVVARNRMPATDTVSTASSTLADAGSPLASASPAAQGSPACATTTLASPDSPEAFKHGHMVMACGLPRKTRWERLWPRPSTRFVVL